MSARDNDKRVRRILLVVLGLNIAVAVAKLLYGVVSGSVAIRADGIHSLFDGGSNIIGLVALWLASRPPDEKHPYGHRKFESMAALIIGVFVILGFLEVARSMVTAVRAHVEPRIDGLGFAVAGGTLLVSIGVTWYEARAGKRLGSELLSADARHTLGDMFATVGVLVGFVGIRMGYPSADLVAAGVVCVLIAHTAWEIVRRAFDSLLDVARLDPDAVARVAHAIPGVENCHAVRSRGASGHVLVDMHIQVDPEMTVALAHDLTHRVEAAVREHFPKISDVVIHTEPLGADDP